MADFAKFGVSAVNMAELLAGNCDRKAIADFLVQQQQAVQKKTVEDRLSNKNKPIVNEQGARISDPAITGSASGAMERMKVLLANMPKSKRG